VLLKTHIIAEHLSRFIYLFMASCCGERGTVVWSLDLQWKVREFNYQPFHCL